MAREVLTIAGAVVGAYFGAPQLGFVIGSLLGNAVDPVKIYGPRLTDAKIQTARDGVPITWGAGRFRTAGTIIAVQPGKPTEHEDDGGKGGPEEVTYTYTRTHAILVCEGPILGIRRIWRDQKLVYDVSGLPTEGQGDLTVDEMIQLAIGGLAYSTNFAEGMTIYLGDETQMPDPELEALFGVGNVPAHRGTAYVVFKDDDVTARQGSISNYEFEVVKEGSIAPYTQDPPSDFMDDCTAWYPLENTTASLFGGYSFAPYFSGVAYEDGPKLKMGVFPQSTRVGEGPAGSGSWSINTIVIIPSGTVSRSAQIGRGDNDTFDWVAYAGVTVITDAFGATTAIAFCFDSGIADYVESGAFAWPGDETTLGMVWDQVALQFRVYTNGSLRSTLNVASYPTAHSGGIRKGYGSESPGDELAYRLDEWGSWDTRALTATELLYLYNNGGFRNYVEALTNTGGFGDGNIPGAIGWEIDENGNYVKLGATVDLITADQVALASFLNEICLRSGIEAGDIDVSAISGMIDGFVIARETTAAALLTILGQGFFFDVVEQDGMVTFVPRGGASAMTITEDDLVALEGYPVEEVRDQEVERPRKVNIAYFDPDLQYISSKQTAERRAGDTSAIGERTIELPIVYGKDDAAQTADKVIKISWIDLLGSKAFTLPDEFSALVPTDCVDLNYRGKTQRIRLEKIEEENGKMMIQARQDRLSAYSSSVVGTGDPQNPTYPVPLGATLFYAFNLPSLRAQDNVPGAYFVARGYSANWPGCLVQISFDGGVTFVDVVTMRTSSVMGVLSAACDDPADSPASEVISVQLRGTIASVTPAQIADGANAWAIADASDVAEVGQAQTVVDNGSGAYDLTDPLRGQLGTTAVAHAADEKFAMLSNVIFQPLDLAYAGATLIIRAVTLGTAAENNASISFIYQPGDIVFDGGGDP